MVRVQPFIKRSLLKRLTLAAVMMIIIVVMMTGDDSDSDYDIAGPKVNPLGAGWPFFWPLPYSCVIRHWAIYLSQIEVC
jgi:hypothetical protein